MKVGMLHARSGVAGMWAPALDAAALLGAAEINQQGGILGEELEMVFGDCGLSAGEAVAAVDQLIDVDNVGAIIGSHTSDLRDTISGQSAVACPTSTPRNTKASPSAPPPPPSAPPMSSCSARRSTG